MPFYGYILNKSMFSYHNIRHISILCCIVLTVFVFFSMKKRFYSDFHAKTMTIHWDKQRRKRLLPPCPVPTEEAVGRGQSLRSYSK